MVALVRFYARGAGFLAQRNALATLVLVILSLAFIPDAPAVLAGVALALTAADAPRVAGLTIAALALVLTYHAVPTVRLGLGGWIRSLPLEDRQHRRAMAAALLVPLAPVAAAIGVACLYTVSDGRSLALGNLLGVLIGLLGASAAAIPVRRGLLARSFALGAAVVWVQGSWIGVAASLVLLGAWDRTAGAILLPRRAAERRRLADRWIAPLLAWRALGWRLLAPTLVGVALVGAAGFYRFNNGLSAAEAGFGTRLAVLAALGYGLSLLGDGLVARRPPWPWARSLSLSSRRRVADDVIALGIPCLPTIQLAALLDWASALVALAALPLLATLAIGALRGAGGRLLRVSGLLFVRGAVVVVAVSLWPALALVALGATPIALVLAARADRGQIVTAWQPLHHSAAGDPASGSVR